MNEKPLRPRLILLPDGTISSAHCTCMAGLGEAYSHSTTVDFFILHCHLLGQKSAEALSCMDKLSAWTVPNLVKAITPRKIKDINWGRQTSYSSKYFHLKIYKADVY